mmetsp:Transcript_32628/g.97458  ORF Transcript_32628/g.97458 Transcript_32628/m.97458 type:complete len:110 (-) Transcript_32628:160-489(-)
MHTYGCNMNTLTRRSTSYQLRTKVISFSTATVSGRKDGELQEEIETDYGDWRSLGAQGTKETLGSGLGGKGDNTTEVDAIEIHANKTKGMGGPTPPQGYTSGITLEKDK